MKNNWTLGKGIAIAGKWIAIALIITILFTSTLNFIDNRLECKYGSERYGYPIVKPDNPSITPPCDESCKLELNQTIVFDELK